MVPSTQNGVKFPPPGQAVEGFSGIVDGRQHGEILAMPDNGFGNKANSRDFLIRAYYLRPHFKTADGGSGKIEVGDVISFRDPFDRFGFPIVNDATETRLLTGSGHRPRVPAARESTATSGSATSRPVDPALRPPGVGSWNGPSPHRGDLNSGRRATPVPPRLYGHPPGQSRV